MSNIFIGSTGKDLADYRASAIDICNRLSLTPNAMEFFEAMGAGATEGSKRKLDRADVYVGIFAHRYGYIETGYNKAVTEIEFDYAGERGLERLCFLVNLDYPWPPGSIDYEHHARLQVFKDKVNTTLIRAEFTTVDDFKAKLIQALIAWQKKHDATGPQDPQGATSLPPVAIAPPCPALVIGRETALNDLKSRLGITPDSPKRDLTIIRGWPGVGKTTLVNTLAYDPDVRTVFSDGILWAALGEQASTFSALTTWGRQLGLPNIARTPTLEDLIGQLRAILQRKRMLLIVDDVWQSEAAIPGKRIIGPECALLITTRFGDVARELANVPEEDIYPLAILSDNKALELLRRLAPGVVQQYPDRSRKLVRDLEGLPLAIRVAGRLLASESGLGVSVYPLLDELGESHRLLEEVAPDDRFDPHTGTTPTINLLLKRSTDRLDAATRDCFAMLGAFAPKPATFDQNAMAYVWEVDDPLPTVRKLVDRGLLEPIVTLGRFQMHAVLVMHAQSLLEE